MTTIRQYQRPELLLAVQFDGTEGCAKDLSRWLRETGHGFASYDWPVDPTQPTRGHLYVLTTSGRMTLEAGAWLVVHHGRLGVYEAEIFQAERWEPTDQVLVPGPVATADSPDRPWVLITEGGGGVDRTAATPDVEPTDATAEAAVERDFDRMSAAGEQMAWLGTDAERWAQRMFDVMDHIKLPWHVAMDPTPGGTLHGWLSSAIEAGRSAGRAEGAAGQQGRDVKEHWDAGYAAAAAPQDGDTPPATATINVQVDSDAILAQVQDQVVALSLHEVRTRVWLGLRRRVNAWLREQGPGSVRMDRWMALCGATPQHADGKGWGAVDRDSAEFVAGYVQGSTDAQELALGWPGTMPERGPWDRV